MQNLKPTFNDIPEMLVQILNGMKELHSKVDRWDQSNSANDEPLWFNVPELIKYLPTHPAEQTIYSWTSSHRIPFHKKGRRIIFNKSEIDKWLLENEYCKSELELEQEAMEFVSSKRKHII